MARKFSHFIFVVLIAVIVTPLACLPAGVVAAALDWAGAPMSPGISAAIAFAIACYIAPRIAAEF